MKTKERNKLEKFSGTVLIPVFETTAKSIVRLSSKV
jgi:leucyl aminopeptidase